MELQSAFDHQLSQTAPLDGLDQLIWKNLTEAVETPAHPWNLSALSTAVLQDGEPCQPRSRTVVLRLANPDQRTIDCHTDVRSEKASLLDQPSQPSNASWLFYDSISKIQIRMDGSSRLIDDAEADDAWKTTTLASRSSYLSVQTPAQKVNSADPPSTDDRNATMEESERGRANFRIYRTEIRQIDFLYLRRDHHVRAIVRYDADNVNRYWVVP